MNQINRVVTPAMDLRETPMDGATAAGATPVQAADWVEDVHVTPERAPHTVSATDASVTPEPETVQAEAPAPTTSVPPAGGNGGGRIPPSVRKVAGAAGGGVKRVGGIAKRTFGRRWVGILLFRCLLAAIAVWGLANVHHFSVGGIGRWAHATTVSNLEPAMTRMWKVHPEIGIMLGVSAALLSVLVLVLVTNWLRRRFGDENSAFMGGRLSLVAGALLVVLTVILALRRQDVPFSLQNLGPWVLMLLAFVGWGGAAWFTGRTAWKGFGPVGRVLVGVGMAAVLLLFLIYVDAAWQWGVFKTMAQMVLFGVLVFGLYQASMVRLASDQRTTHVDIIEDDIHDLNDGHHHPGGDPADDRR